MISPAIVASNHTPQTRRENIEFQLGQDVERLATEAGSVALILAEATSQGLSWTQGIESEVGTTYETIPLRDGQVTIANVVSTAKSALRKSAIAVKHQWGLAQQTHTLLVGEAPCLFRQFIGVKGIKQRPSPYVKKEKARLASVFTGLPKLQTCNAEPICRQ